MRRISRSNQAAVLLRRRINNPGGLPERPMGADCKSAGSAFSGSNPLPTTILFLQASRFAGIYPR